MAARSSGCKSGSRVKQSLPPATTGPHSSYTHLVPHAPICCCSVIPIYLFIQMSKGDHIYFPGIASAISEEFYPIFLRITVVVLLPLYGFAASHRCSDKLPATQNIIRSFMFCTVLVKCLLFNHQYSVKKSGTLNSGDTPLDLVHVGH